MVEDSRVERDELRFTHADIIDHHSKLNSVNSMSNNVCMSDFPLFSSSAVLNLLAKVCTCIFKQGKIHSLGDDMESSDDGQS